MYRLAGSKADATGLSDVQIGCMPRPTPSLYAEE
jgi:hypothetical protein